jgi:succinate dehydrogenase / fumarate reductase cytochrome b subunit
MKIKRPLSPHLQVYRPQITSVLSILHRITGIFLASGTLVLIIWLAAIATSAPFYKTLCNLTPAWLREIYFFILSYAFFYHLCNGIRHLSWDAGYGFDLKSVHLSGWIVVGSSIFLTLLTWALT